MAVEGIALIAHIGGQTKGPAGAGRRYRQTSRIKQARPTPRNSWNVVDSIYPTLRCMNAITYIRERRSKGALAARNGHGAKWSRGKMVTGPGFSSPNPPDQERTTAYRDSSGPDSRSDAHCATLVGDWEEPSGESRLRSITQ